MTRSSLLVCLVISGGLAGCGGSPSEPTGIPVFAAGRVSMTFTPQDKSFAAAAEEYRDIWVSEGSAIVDALERGTGLRFLETHVDAVIFEGTSQSGIGGGPIYLRASYPPDVKRSVLVHENGHRLIAQLKSRPADLDEHHVLDLFLYDVWESLWGRDQADHLVTVESALKGLYDYEGTWKWALSLTKAERASRFADIVRANGK